MRIRKSTLKKIILEESELRLDELNWGSFGATLDKLKTGASGAQKKFRKFLHGNELDLKDPIWRQWDGIKKEFDKLLGQAKRGNYKSDPQWGIKIYTKFIDTRLAPWIKKASGPLTVNFKKNTKYHKELRKMLEFDLLAFEKVVMGVKRGSKKPLKNKEGKQIRPSLKDLSPLWSKYKGPKVADTPEAGTAAGKKTEMTLDKSSMKPLKVALAKSSNKESVKEILRALFDEMPPKATKHLKQALSDLKAEQ